MQWITEIEAAKSLDDLKTPKSVTDNDFLNYKELDLRMTIALKRCHDKQTHFRKKISVEEQRAQKDNRFLGRSQIAYLIHEYFRLTGSYEGLSGLFSIILDNDDIQDFDLQWEKTLLLTGDPPSDKDFDSQRVLPRDTTRMSFQRPLMSLLCCDALCVINSKLLKLLTQ